MTREQAAALDKYLAERKGKRLQEFDILKRMHHGAHVGQTTRYGGMRRIDGQALVLVHRAQGVMVLPVDEATARRTKRLNVGDHITIAAQGSIRAQARSTQR